MLRNVAFIAGAFIAVLSLLTIYDEDVITVEHVLLVISVSGAALAICRYVLVIVMYHIKLIWLFLIKRIVFEGLLYQMNNLFGARKGSLLQC